MSEIINSVTKYRQSEEMLKAMTERAFGHRLADFSCKELSGGLCNAVYLIETNDGKTVVKVASPKSVVVMRHERDYVPNEARMLRLFADKLNIPAPKLIYYDDSGLICPVPYFFMSFINGTPLKNAAHRMTAEQINGIKYRLGEICREISSVKAPKFGIPAMPETYTDSNYEFVCTLFTMLFEDIADKELYVPEAPERECLRLIEKCRAALDEVKNPVYIHTDTWDGNLMVENGRLTGLIDYAAVLYGDPLMNHDFHDFCDVPNEHFCRGFGKETFTQSEQICLLVYRIWHRLGMIAERGFRGYDDPNTYSWVLDEYTKEVVNLKKLVD